MREKIPILKCDNCNEEVDLCDECDKGFAVGQKIICLYDGELHFCSEECLRSFVNEEARESKTYLDNTDF